MNSELTPRRAVRPLDPLRIWLGNLSHGLSRHSLLMALAQLGMHPEEVALYHQHNGRNSAAVLRFEDAAGASAAMGRLNGLHHEGLQGRGRRPWVCLRVPLVSATVGWKCCSVPEVRCTVVLPPLPCGVVLFGDLGVAVAPLIPVGELLGS